MGPGGAVAIALAIALTGCDRVFGLDHVAPRGPRITGSYRQHYLGNNASYEPEVIEHIFEPGTIALSATLDDGTDVPVTYEADGSFWFSVRRLGQAYRFVSIVEGARVEWQTNTPVLDIAGSTAGRLDRLPVSTQTFVEMPYPNQAPGVSAAYLASTGIYTYSYTASWGPMVRFDWRLAAPMVAGVPGLLDAGRYDRLYGLEMMVVDDSSPSMPWSVIRAVSEASVNQLGQTTVTVPRPQLVVRDTCLRFTAANVAEHARIVAAAPRTYASEIGTWLVFAVPAPDVMSTAGAAFLASCVHGLRDLDYAPAIHNPFPGTQVLVQSGAQAEFDVQLGTSTPLRLINRSSRYQIAQTAAAPGACTAPTTVLDSTLALATQLALDGVVLDSDGMVVELGPDNDVTLSWATTPGGVVHFSVVLSELVIVNGGTAQIPRRVVNVANQLEAVFDRSLFVPGNKYIFSVSGMRDYPGAATGDWRTTRAPFEQAVIHSHYFEVASR
jgi:hypothetical protein